MKFYSVPAQTFIPALAKELRSQISMPVWAVFVKTGAGRERPPQQEDWFYIRAASILRTVAMKGPIGTQKLRTKFGGRKNKGYKPEHFQKAGGSVIREILQQLDKAGFTRTETKLVHKGRVLTPKGVSFLDKVAKPFTQGQVHAQKPTKTEKTEHAEKVEKSEKANHAEKAAPKAAVPAAKPVPHPN